MNQFDDVYFLKTGEEPGKGSYLCKNCSVVVEIVQENGKLPNCPCCEQQFFSSQYDKKSMSTTEQSL